MLFTCPLSHVLRRDGMTERMTQEARIQKAPSRAEQEPSKEDKGQQPEELECNTQRHVAVNRKVRYGLSSTYSYEPHTQ